MSVTNKNEITSITTAIDALMPEVGQLCPTSGASKHSEQQRFPICVGLLVMAMIIAPMIIAWHFYDVGVAFGGVLVAAGTFSCLSMQGPVGGFLWLVVGFGVMSVGADGDGGWILALVIMAGSFVAGLLQENSRP